MTTRFAYLVDCQDGARHDWIIGFKNERQLFLAFVKNETQQEAEEVAIEMMKERLLDPEIFEIYHLMEHPFTHHFFNSLERNHPGFFSSNNVLEI